MLTLIFKSANFVSDMYHQGTKKNRLPRRLVGCRDGGLVAVVGAGSVVGVARVVLGEKKPARGGLGYVGQLLPAS